VAAVQPVEVAERQHRLRPTRRARNIGEPRYFHCRPIISKVAKDTKGAKQSTTTEVASQRDREL
jgi:hypothetical protein